MGATDLIFKLRSDGYSISADGGYLDISPADNLSPELLQQLKQGKPEILCALHQEEELKRLEARTPGTSEKDVSVNKIKNGESAHSEKFGISKVYAQSSQDEQLRELAMKARRQKILTMLDENPGVPRAVHRDTQNDPDNVILTIAIRNLATFEMLIPKARYEPWQFMTMLDKAGGLH